MNSKRRHQNNVCNLTVWHGKISYFEIIINKYQDVTSQKITIFLVLNATVKYDVKYLLIIFA